MFTFKQFSIQQDRTAMKVGTDGVLLGAWFQSYVLNRQDLIKTILDIGTGTGLIALMAAQRFPNAQITGIEIDQDAATQASENASNSKFSNRVQIKQGDLFEMNSEHYDSIVCNPPYFIKSLKNPDKKRETARHASSTLFFRDLFLKVNSLLNEDGTFALIYPTLEWEKIENLIPKNWQKIHITNIFPTLNSPSKRILVEYQKKANDINTENKPIYTNNITIEIERHTYTPQYKSLTKDFYIKM